jgi:hypothetical protein
MPLAPTAAPRGARATGGGRPGEDTTTPAAAAPHETTQAAPTQHLLQPRLQMTGMLFRPQLPIPPRHHYHITHSLCLHHRHQLPAHPTLRITLLYKSASEGHPFVLQPKSPPPLLKTPGFPSLSFLRFCSPISYVAPAQASTHLPAGVQAGEQAEAEARPYHTRAAAVNFGCFVSVLVPVAPASGDAKKCKPRGRDTASDRPTVNAGLSRHGCTHKMMAALESAAAARRFFLEFFGLSLLLLVRPLLLFPSSSLPCFFDE